MPVNKSYYDNNIPSDRPQEDGKVADKVFGAKPPFGKIFNIKAIIGFIIALVLIVLGLIFIPGLL